MGTARELGNLWQYGSYGVCDVRYVFIGSDPLQVFCYNNKINTLKLSV